jgi:hypothetical protein
LATHLHPPHALQYRKRQDPKARIIDVDSVICPSRRQHKNKGVRNKKDAEEVLLLLYVSPLLRVMADVHCLSLALGSRVARGRYYGDIGGGGGKEENTTEQASRPMALRQRLMRSYDGRSPRSHPFFSFSSFSAICSLRGTTGIKPDDRKMQIGELKGQNSNCFLLRSHLPQARVLCPYLPP